MARGCAAGGSAAATAPPPPCGRRHGRHRRHRRRVPAPAPPARPLWNATHVGGLGRQPEARDLLDRRHLPAGKRHDADANSGSRCRSLPAAALRRGRRRLPPRSPPAGRRSRRCRRPRRHDREDDELAVRRELRAGAARLLEFLSGLQVADDERAVLGLRRQRIRKPLAVIRQARAADRLPGFIHVVGQGPLGRGFARTRATWTTPLANQSHEEKGTRRR